MSVKRQKGIKLVFAKIQGWLSDLEIDGPTFLLIWVKVCLKKVIASGFFCCYVFTILFKYYLEGRFLPKRHIKLPYLLYLIINHTNL